MKTGDRTEIIIQFHVFQKLITSIFSMLLLSECYYFKPGHMATNLFGLEKVCCDARP